MDDKVYGSGKRDSRKRRSDQHELPPAVQRSYGTAGQTAADKVKADARGQFVRRRKGTNPGGAHSANPVVLSGDGDATQPVKENQDLRRKGSD